MFFKIGVLKIFENFTRKHLRWNLFIVNFFKNRLKRRFSPLKIAKFFGTSFYRTPPLIASVFYKNFVDISYENSHTHTRRLNVAAAYLFLTFNFILVCGMSFPNWWDTYIYYSECYRIYPVFSLPFKSAVMENSRHCINYFQLL